MTWTLPDFPNIPIPDWLDQDDEEPGGDHPRFAWRGPPDVWVFVDEHPNNGITYSVVLDGVPCKAGTEWDDVFVIDTFDSDLARAGYEQAILFAKEHGCDVPDAWRDRVPLYDPDGVPRPGFGFRQLGQRTIQPATARALEEINRHRAAIGMPPLDIRASGWTDQDVLDEAERLRRLPNPLEDLKHRLI